MNKKLREITQRLEGCIRYYGLVMTTEEVIFKARHCADEKTYHRRWLTKMEQSGILATEEMVLLMQELWDSIQCP